MRPNLNKLQQKVFKVFYRDYVRDEAVPSTEPRSMLDEKIPELARQLLQHADNFIGVFDRNETILQAYLADDGQQVQLALIYADGRGEHAALLPHDKVLTLLQNLPPVFTSDILNLRD